MEILWPIIKNFFPPKMLLEIYCLAPFYILTWIIFLLEKHIIKNTDRVINMFANSEHYKFNRFNKIVYKKEGRESFCFYSLCIADDKEQHGIIAAITAYYYLV